MQKNNKTHEHTLKKRNKYERVRQTHPIQTIQTHTPIQTYKHTNALKEPGKKAFGKQHKTLDNKRINKTKFYIKMKKITKILDSVMSRLKRTCVAKAIAVVAVATIAMNSFAQEETITGVKDLAGKDLTYINNHLKDDNNPEDKGRMFFLYNEKTGKFLNLGSYWGTHVALADYGKPLWVVKGERKESIVKTNNVLFFGHNMATTLSEDQGPYVGWSKAKSGKPDEDRGVYADKKKHSNRHLRLGA